MKTKTVLAALALALAPIAAQAECSWHQEVKMTCADGKVWDDKTKGCVTPTG